jgi:DNA-directed RNA polymerase, mitochondrial
MKRHSTFPTYFDFRGRLYANTAFLNPQGEDSARGLLEFSKGKPLGSGGYAWLKVHIANCWGEDKVSLEDRVTWTEEHKMIFRCAMLILWAILMDGS